MKQHQKGS